MSKNQNWMSFFKSVYFLKNLGILIGIVFGFLFLVNFGLKTFTNHGEAIEMPDLNGEFLETATDLVKKHKFKLTKADSVFIVGKPGGLIINQNPKPGSKVKSGRTIYLTVTKEKADEIPSSRLPVLYGKSYDRKSRELKNGFEIFSRIVDEKYDPGPENYILAVIYEGDTIVSANERKMDVLIEKGGQLDMIVSKSTGGRLDLPNMVCKTYSEAVFLARTLNIFLDAEVDDAVTDKYDAYVSRQQPSFSPDQKILMGDTLKVFLAEEKPFHCVDDDSVFEEEQ